ncbi:MAG: hypothetical protein U9P42_07505 [Candidatus Fermentibacteria bacterium]|nr:hypothetical protein [Candidatus Fermentibacteria bacterium]
MANEFNITPAEIEDGKTMGGIAYFGILGFLIAFLTKKDNKYVMYHAQQSLILVIFMLVAPIPVVGQIIALGAFVLFIIGLLNGFKGEIKPLPLVGNLAFKFGILKPEGGDNPPAPPAAPGAPDVE